MSENSSILNMHASNEMLVCITAVITTVAFDQYLRIKTLPFADLICRHAESYSQQNIIVDGFHWLLNAGAQARLALCKCRASATSPVGQVSTGPLFSLSALTADLGDYDVHGSIDEQCTGSTELAA